MTCVASRLLTPDEEFLTAPAVCQNSQSGIHITAFPGGSCKQQILFHCRFSGHWLTTRVGMGQHARDRHSTLTFCSVWCTMSYLPSDLQYIGNLNKILPVNLECPNMQNCYAHVSWMWTCTWGRNWTKLTVESYSTSSVLRPSVFDFFVVYLLHFISSHSTNAPLSPIIYLSSTPCLYSVDNNCPQTN